jgi:transposase-like protein
MQDSVSLQCPYCGENVELNIDGGGGVHQEYVEDCPVCCRPWQVQAWIEDDGSWSAVLRTSDE